MSLLWRALGILLIFGTAVDVFRTVLLPVSSGSVNRVLSLLLWRSARILPSSLRPPALSLSGPSSLILTTVAWLSMLWLGFALLYLPGVAGLSYSSDARFDAPGLFEALYLSGTALTTLGFGDVVGQSVGVRLLTVLEAAAGIGVLTATLGYLPAIYTLISELRTGNQAVADLGAEEPAGAAELLSADGALVLDEVRRDVIAARQHLLRFPVLHYFHPPYDESVAALCRGATGLWVAGHFADDPDQALHRHVTALEQALRRLVEQLVPHGGAGAEPDPDSARAHFDQARDASQHPEVAGEADVPDASVELLARMESVVNAYAGSHALPASRRG